MKPTFIRTNNSSNFIDIAKVSGKYEVTLYNDWKEVRILSANFVDADEVINILSNGASPCCQMSHDVKDISPKLASLNVKDEFAA